MRTHAIRGRRQALLLLAILGLSVLLALSSTSAYAAPDSYTVRDGDTLFAIAASLGIDSGSQSSWVDSVVQLNGLGSPDQLSVGQQLKLPGSTPASNRSSSAPSSTAQPAAATTGGSTYTVKSGDSLYAIAAALGYSDAEQFTKAVVQLNSLSGPDQLSVGQVLKLPGNGTQSSSPAANGTASTVIAPNGGGTTQQAAAPAAASVYNQAAFNAKSTVSSAECQVSTNPTCDYSSNDKLVIPSLNNGDASRCGSATINASVNVYDVRTDGAMGIPVADCDVVRQNFGIFNGYGGYPGSGGTTVLAGHVDYHPHFMAVFWYLREIKPGTEIDYINKDGKKIVYTVDWAKAISDPNYNWASLAQSTSQETLVLITCDGVFNSETHEYDHRFVAHAVRSN
jgi:LPXTG-site transpeptidase (sortase) family protein